MLEHALGSRSLRGGAGGPPPVGRLLYDLAVETTRELMDESSATRSELRAVAAYLRYTSGYRAMIGSDLEC